MSTEDRVLAPAARQLSPVLRAVDLVKTYPALSPSQPGLELFRSLSFEVFAGERVAIIGRSGTGKSSLLHLLAGLDRPTTGTVWLGSTEITRLGPQAAARLRNCALGYIWQFHYLLPEFTALENIALPLLARGVGRKQALEAAESWLKRVELGDRAGHRAGELSGGEQQRVAMARALVTEPQVLLADEPTGDLDDHTAAQVFDLLQRLCRDAGLAAVVVTHHRDLAGRCDRVLHLSEGRLLPAADGL